MIEISAIRKGLLQVISEHTHQSVSEAGLMSATSSRKYYRIFLDHRLTPRDLQTKADEELEKNFLRPRQEVLQFAIESPEGRSAAFVDDGDAAGDHFKRCGRKPFGKREAEGFAHFLGGMRGSTATVLGRQVDEAHAALQEHAQVREAGELNARLRAVERALKRIGVGSVKGGEGPGEDVAECVGDEVGLDCRRLRLAAMGFLGHGRACGWKRNGVVGRPRRLRPARRSFFVVVVSSRFLGKRSCWMRCLPLLGFGDSGVRREGQSGRGQLSGRPPPRPKPLRRGRLPRPQSRR